MGDEFVVISSNPERRYTKVYHDFLDSSVLTGKEKLVFIFLKRYLDFRLDHNGTFGNVYPTLATLAAQADMTEKTVRELLKSLEKKGILKIKRQGKTKPNIYEIQDFARMWNDGSPAAEMPDPELDLSEIPYEKLKAEIERREQKRKEKEPDTTAKPTKAADGQAQIKDQIYKKNNTKKYIKSQASEKYSMEQLKELYSYDLMMNDYEMMADMIEMVLEILYDTVNSNRKTIRIAGEDKPSNVVIGRLLKLTYEEIIYSIDKVRAAGKIKNARGYTLTVLYRAKEQMPIDIENQVKNDILY